MDSKPDTEWPGIGIDKFTPSLFWNKDILNMNKKIPSAYEFIKSYSHCNTYQWLSTCQTKQQSCQYD